MTFRLEIRVRALHFDQWFGNGQTIALTGERRFDLMAIRETVRRMQREMTDLGIHVGALSWEVRA